MMKSNEQENELKALRTDQQMRSQTPESNCGGSVGTDPKILRHQSLNSQVIVSQRYNGKSGLQSEDRGKED